MAQPVGLLQLRQRQLRHAREGAAPLLAGGLGAGAAVGHGQGFKKAQRHLAHLIRQALRQVGFEDLRLGGGDALCGLHDALLWR